MIIFCTGAECCFECFCTNMATLQEDPTRCVNVYLKHDYVNDVLFLPRHVHLWPITVTLSQSICEMFICGYCAWTHSVKIGCKCYVITPSTSILSFNWSFSNTISLTTEQHLQQLRLKNIIWSHSLVFFRCEFVWCIKTKYILPVFFHVASPDIEKATIMSHAGYLMGWP